ncbi:MAG: AAA family ATPase [Candidatus Sumerlaeia bacterium]|nr:AAA family ATPase [Candidatus Sumerlaeia bacterium]
MIIKSVKFRNYKCFKNEWAGFDEIKPINVIIGKNNSGKSSLLELIDIVNSTEGKKLELDSEIIFNADDNDLNKSRINCPSIKEINILYRPMTNSFSYDKAKATELLRYKCAFEDVFKYFDNNLKNITHRTEYGFGKSVKIQAERNIVPEEAEMKLLLQKDGKGATNIIRRFLNTADTTYNRDDIRKDLMDSLNQIFAHDGKFNEIIVRQYDDQTKDAELHNKWEVYLLEEDKGFVPLSKSGSGLKTIILVLLNLLIIPKIDNKEKSEYCFCFEELENNLHPSLHRRLLAYIQDYSKDHGCQFFLTTHSSVVLDAFGNSDKVQFTQVIHDGVKATTKPILAHFDKIDAISNLGVKPSDLLFANGIIWVEGPSDRIYINKWIELASKEKLREGLHYQCAFYGGAVLAHYSANENVSNLSDLINVVRINSNFFFLFDRDNTDKRNELKKAVKDRVMEIDSNKLHTGYWITKGKEIENYIPERVCKTLSEKKRKPVKSVHMDNFFEVNGINPSTFDKVDFAVKVTKILEPEDMLSVLDWKEQMEKLVTTIKSWNT